MIDMNTVTDEQADYMNTPMEAVEEIDMLWDKLSAFFPELGGYIETDFCERTARRMVWDIEKGFAALPDKFRAVAFHHAVLTDDSDIVEAFIKAAKNAKADIDTDFSDSEYGTPPLMQACYNKCRNAFVSLVAGGASLSVTDAMGRGLAYACVFSHNLAFMKWAQKHGVVFDLSNPVDAVLPLAVTVGRLNPARLDSSRTDKRQTTRHALMRLTKSFQSSNSLIEVASLRQSDIREDFFFNRIKSFSSSKSAIWFLPIILEEG